MKLFFKGKWFEGTNPIAVCNPFDGSVVDEVPTATAEQVQEAVAAAEQRSRGAAPSLLSERNMPSTSEKYIVSQSRQTVRRVSSAPTMCCSPM